MSYVSVKGTDIYYEGTMSNNVPIIFVPGAGGSSERWSKELLTLNGQYNTIAVDLPGHGKSGGNLFTSISDMAQFIADFAGSLSLGEFILVGHSMGGAIAQEVALQYPKNVKGLILIGTGGKLRVSHEILGTLAAGQIPFKDADHLFGSDTPEYNREVTLRQMNEVPQAVYLADFNACNNFDRLLEIKEIKVPCLIIVGDEDAMTPLKYSQFLQANLVNSQLRIINGTGHMCMLEKPAEVTEIIESFLAATLKNS